MTTPPQRLIDPLTVTALRLEAHAGSGGLGVATGFVVMHLGRPYLITNWHVVAGRNPETGELLSVTAAEPERLAIIHHATAGLGSWVIREEPLRYASGSPRWIEHSLGRAIDVVALPLSVLDPEVQLYPFDLGLADFDVLVAVAMTVSIIGYPFGLATSVAFPIWKTGHIATDPDLDYDGRPAFLIDATTREGMSGSPVVLRQYGGYSSSTAGLVIGGGPATRFLGVYSGRIHGSAEVGRVWRPSVVREILARAAV